MPVCDCTAYHPCPRHTGPTVPLDHAVGQISYLTGRLVSILGPVVTDAVLGSVIAELAAAIAAIAGPPPSDAGGPPAAWPAPLDDAT